MTDKDNIIRQIYYDVHSGFQSAYETYKQANKIMGSITMNDVKEFLNKQKSRQLTAH